MCLDREGDQKEREYSVVSMRVREDVKDSRKTDASRIGQYEYGSDQREGLSRRRKNRQA